MPKAADTEEIEWAYPDSVSNCMKEVKSGGTSVSFSWCDPKLGESGEAIDELCSLLSKSKKIQALDLDNMNLSDSSVEALCEALKKNKTLHTLVLSNNDLGANAAKAIDAMLKLNKSIKKINLDGNPRIVAHLMEPITTQLQARA